MHAITNMNNISVLKVIFETIALNGAQPMFEKTVCKHKQISLIISITQCIQKTHITIA
jgi:hypothetical protein